MFIRLFYFFLGKSTKLIQYLNSGFVLKLNFTNILQFKTRNTSFFNLKLEIQASLILSLIHI